MSNRRTDLTEQQRQAMQQARRLLTPHFPGEVLKLSLPKRLIEEKLEREREIGRELSAGRRPEEVARAFGVSRSYVYVLRGRFKSSNFHP